MKERIGISGEQAELRKELGIGVPRKPTPRLKLVSLDAIDCRGCGAPIATPTESRTGVCTLCGTPFKRVADR